MTFLDAARRDGQKFISEEISSRPSGLTLHQHHVPADDFGAAGDGTAASPPAGRRSADAGFQQNFGRLLAQLDNHRFVLVGRSRQRPYEALEENCQQEKGKIIRIEVRKLGCWDVGRRWKKGKLNAI